MAADVSSLVRILNGHLDEQRTKGEENRRSRGDVLTKDLLGLGSSSSSMISSSFASPRANSKDIDLDVQVPSGWEKRLDLKSGKVFLQRCNSPISSSSTMTTSSDRKPAKEPRSATPLIRSPPSNTNLDLKLVPSYDYGSVCTLDKVKSALERAEREDSAKKRRSLTISVSSSDDEEERRSSSSSNSTGTLFAGGCPSCLMYVMISKGDPRCPRCDSLVPIPGGIGVRKKAKLDLDLNLSLAPCSP